MKVLVFRVNQPPVVEDVPDTLDAMRQIVGGSIEGHSILMHGVLLVCNEYGKYTCPSNRYIPLFNDTVHGDFVVTAHDAEGAGRDITDAEVASAISVIEGGAFFAPTARSLV